MKIKYRRLIIILFISVILAAVTIFRFGKRVLPEATAWVLVQNTGSFKAFIDAKRKLEREEGISIQPYRIWIIQQYKERSLFDEPEIYLAGGYYFFVNFRNGKWECWKITPKG